MLEVGISEEQFVKSEEVHLKDPEHAKILMDLSQVPISTDANELEVTLDQAKSVFVKLEFKKMDQMKIAMENTKEDPSQLRFKMMFAQAKYADELFEE